MITQGLEEHQVGPSPANWLQIALPVSLARQLLENRCLCIADVRCLDAQSKEVLHRLCLECCTSCLNREDTYRAGVGQPHRESFGSHLRRFTTHDPGAEGAGLSGRTAPGRQPDG